MSVHFVDGRDGITLEQERVVLRVLKTKFFALVISRGHSV